MTTAIQYALMAGASYISTRPLVNRFPVPQGWAEIADLRKNDPISGFEAVTFTQGTNIVISFAGTDHGDYLGDLSADADLVAGVVPIGYGSGWAQLEQAAEYYMQVATNDA